MPNVPGIPKAKYDRCLAHVASQRGGGNKYAICTASLKRNIRKPRRTRR